MKHSTPWKGMDRKEAQDHKLLEISALLEDYLEHHLDVITDSDWFRDLVGILKISFTVMLHSNIKEVVVIGSSGILILMLGAVLTHIRVESDFRKYIASVTMLTISILILIFTMKLI